MIRLFPIHLPMLKKIYCFLFVGSFMLAGCRSHILYDYQEGQVAVVGGTLTVELNGESINDDKSGKKLRVLSNPYYLIIRYTSTQDNFDRVVLQNVRMNSLGSSWGKRFLDSASDDIFTLPGDISAASFSLEKLTIEYEDFEVVGTVSLYSERKLLQQADFKVPLKRNFQKKRTFDLFNRIMGV